jgi:hypothetical protein
LFTLLLKVDDDPGDILIFWLLMGTIGWAVGMLLGAYA